MKIMPTVDGEPVYQVAINGYWFDVNVEDYIKPNSIKRKLYTFPPDASAKIAQLEDEKAELVEALEITNKNLGYGLDCFEIMSKNKALLTKMKGKP